MQSRIRSERLKREYLCISLKSLKMDKTFDATCKRECSICLRDLHLSAVACSCSEEKFACLDHAKQLCTCPWSNKILLYRYGISELNVLYQALDGKLSAVFKWGKEDLGLTMTSVTSKGSKHTPENVSSSLRPWHDSKMKESIAQKILDAYSKRKERESQAIPNASKGKQSEVASQVMGTSSGPYSSTSGIQSKMKTPLPQSTIPYEMKAKEKMLGCKSATTSISGGINSAGTKTDIKAVGGKFSISRKVEGEPKVSTVSSVTNSRYLSLLQENMLLEVSSDDSTSTSTSSESR